MQIHAELVRTVLFCLDLDIPVGGQGDWTQVWEKISVEKNSPSGLLTLP